MKTKCFRCSFLFLLTFVFSLMLCFFVSAEGEEGRNLNVSLSVSDSANITVKVDGREQTGLSAKVSAGSSVEITVKPNTGYTFEQWNSIPVLPDLVDPSATTVSFAMPDSDVTLTAVLQKKIPQEYSFSVTINDTSYGTADVNGSYWGATTKDKMILEGTKVTLKANPNSGFKFTKWVDKNNVLKDVDLSGSEVSFTMPDGDVDIYLEFNYIVYYFNVELQGEGKVEIDGKEKNSAGKYECTVGEEIAIVATPAEEYVFIGWYSNNYAEFESYEESTTTLICPASDFTVTANFASSVKELTLVSSIGGKAMINLNSTDGATIPTDEPIRCGVDQIYKLVAIPETGYKFSHWESSVSENAFSNPKSVNTDFTMPNDNCTVTAVFVKGNYRVLLETTAGGNATVTEGAFEMGTKVELNAAPLPGYVFSHWECAVGGVLENPTAAKTNAVIPGSDVEIRAVFVLQATFDPQVSTPQDTDDGDGFPWIAILVVFLLSACAIALIIIREKYNLSYAYLIKKFFKKQ